MYYFCYNCCVVYSVVVLGGIVNINDLDQV